MYFSDNIHHFNLDLSTIICFLRVYKVMKNSRPTTAKKNNLLSPKTHKVKTEGKDLDVGQLCDAM